MLKVRKRNKGENFFECIFIEPKKKQEKTSEVAFERRKKFTIFERGEKKIHHSHLFVKARLLFWEIKYLHLKNTRGIFFFHFFFNLRFGSRS